MAWNRPNEVQDTKHEARSTRRVLGAWCLVLGVVCLVVLGVGGYFLFFGDAAPARGTKHEARSTIPEAKHEVRVTPPEARSTKHEARNTRGASPTNKVELTKNAPPPTVLGNRFYESISGGRPIFRKPIFKHHCENVIGGLLSHKPGTRFLPVTFGADFDEEFAEALKEDCPITDKDEPDDVLVKEAVAKAKRQIEAAMKEGQKASEIITDMLQEMNRVADYRDRLGEDFDMLKVKGTAEQILAYQKEANALLDEFGADHLVMSADDEDEINERLEREKTEGKDESEKIDPSTLIIELPNGGN